MTFTDAVVRSRLMMPDSVSLTGPRLVCAWLNRCIGVLALFSYSAERLDPSSVGMTIEGRQAPNTGSIIMDTNM